MAEEFVIANKNDLISIADAIREKAGMSDSLAFPNGFADAIMAIETRVNIDTCTLQVAAPTFARHIGITCFENNKIIYKSITPVTDETIYVENVVCGSVVSFDFTGTAQFYTSALENCTILYQRQSAGGSLLITAQPNEETYVLLFSNK